VIRGWDEGIA
jgi:FKBP-type peptidyl-prolyl cis-trans isomerase 2